MDNVDLAGGESHVTNAHHTLAVNTATVTAPRGNVSVIPTGAGFFVTKRMGGSLPIPSPLLLPCAPSTVYLSATIHKFISSFQTPSVVPSRTRGTTFGQPLMAELGVVMPH
uniref:Uncharacterized protein n=1 Tax=Timema bartmani TaxID=61472 RepID=A0A7R9ETQ9_9NEOP|nr:unnamed protein product [Timema bartmani]